MVRFARNGARVPELGASLVIETITDPAEIAAGLARHAQCKKNWDWLESNASEVYSHRGKIICIAGQELFVGDDVDAVVSAARTKHPDDHGWFTRFIPKERGPRIYAYERIVARL